MTADRGGRPRVPAAAATALVLLASAAAASANTRTLHVETDGWGFAGRPLEVLIEPRGPLAGRGLTVTIFVDDERLADVALPRRAVTYRLPTRGLAPGRHRVLLKCGSERATFEFRLLPRWLPGAAAFATLALAGIALSVVRRRRA